MLSRHNSGIRNTQAAEPRKFALALANPIAPGLFKTGLFAEGIAASQNRPLDPYQDVAHRLQQILSKLSILSIHLNPPPNLELARG